MYYQIIFKKLRNNYVNKILDKTYMPNIIVEQFET